MVATETPICDAGWKAPDFRLKGVDGEFHTLGDLRGERATMVMFICNHCPYVIAALERVVRDAGELAGNGVASVAIMPNDVAAYPADSFDNMVALAERYTFPFAYLIDETQEVARAYDAVCTPDFFGFNADLELQYRGRLDSARLEPAANARRELFEAMVRIAETGKGPAEQLPSMGCSIKWRSD